MQHVASGQGILRRCAAMQEYNNPGSQPIANTFAQANDFIWAPVVGQLPGMKVANPACDFGPYEKGMMYQGTTAGNGLPTDFPEDWYTHDTQPFAKANRVNSSFGATIWIMNPQSTSVWKDTSGEAGTVNANYSGFVDFHKHYLLTAIKSHAEYTNTFADSLGTQSMNGQRDPATGNVETTATWYAKLKTAFTTIQAFIHAAGFEVDANGLVTNASTYNYGDGAMLENALRQPTDGALATYSSTTLQSKWTTHGQRILDTQNAGKNAFPLTQILNTSPLTHGSAQEQAWREYVAAAYYILDLGSLYWDFNCFADTATDHGNAFSRNLKTPMDAAPITVMADTMLVAGTSGNLYGRRYVRGFALLNTSSAAISYTLPRADYKQIDGSAQAASISVPARTGIVLYATVDDSITPPPPPPPPPDSVTFFDMDFGVNTPTVTPFGFDTIPNGVGAGAIMEVLSTGTPPRGQLHIKQVSTLATGPFGRNNIPAGYSDVWYRFVMDDLVTPSAITTFILSQPSGGTNNGDLSLRINASRQFVVRWNAASAADFTDTVLIANGDLVELRHVLNGVASGYSLWINGALRHKNLALTAPAGATVSFVNIGFPAALNAESRSYRFGAATIQMGTPGSLSNTDAPAITVTNPADGTVYTQNTTVLVSVTASDNDGISLVEVQLDGGAWQAMSLQGTTYTTSLNLTGTPGVAKAHTIIVRATDAYSVVANRRQSTASVTVSVNLAGADTIAPVITVTSPSTVASTVPNATATQTIAGTVTDNVGVTSFTINGTVVTLGGGGAFSTSQPLIVGANSFALVAKDAAGNTKTLTYTVTRQDVAANLPPILNVNNPVDGQTYPVGTTNITLSGTASDPDGTLASVTYSYDGSPPVAMALSAGAFSKSIPVTEGGHSITVTATDNLGLTASITVNITVPSSIPVDTGVGTANASLDFGSGQVVVRV